MNKEIITQFFASLLVKEYLNKSEEIKDSIEAMAEIIVGGGPEKEIALSTLQEILFKNA